MKKTVFKILILATLFSAKSFALPVSNLPQIVEDVLTEIRDKYKTLITWKRELKEWEQEYKAITEFNLDGNILGKFTELNNVLKDNGLSIGDLDLSDPQSEIGVYAKQLFTANSFFDDCSYTFLSNIEKNICMHSVAREVEEINVLEGFSENIDNMIDKLSELNGELSGGDSGTVSNENGSTDEDSLESLKQVIPPALSISLDMNDDISAEFQRRADRKKKEQEAKERGEEVNRSDNPILNEFSGEQAEAFNNMMSSFTSASNETDSDENTIKRSQDTAAGIKAIANTMKAMKIQYKLLAMKHRAKAAIDKRQERQIYMKKFDNIEKFVRGTL